MRHGVILLLAVLAALPLFSAERARDRVRADLKKSGIRVGVSFKDKSYVFIGYHAAETNLSTHVAMRESFYQRAVLRAKHDLLKARRTTVTAGDTVQMLDDGVQSVILTKSTCKYLSEAQLHGSSVIASAESWDADKGVYEVAVAVAWSRKLEADGLRAAGRGLPSGDEVEDSPEWEKELSKLHLAGVIGSRQFVDSQGKRRFFGVGAADIEGRRGKQLRDAVRIAELRAARNLGFALHSDAALQDTAVSVLKMMNSGGLSETEAWEEFVMRVSQRCARTIMGHEVFSADTVVHPLTGHRLYISVYGVEPNE